MPRRRIRLIPATVALLFCAWLAVSLSAISASSLNSSSPNKLLPDKVADTGASAWSDIVDYGLPARRVFTALDGLPESSIMAMAFDKQHYLWVGTQDGAAYYNGRHWTTVNMPDQTVSNYIKALLVTSDGSIWFGKNDGGLSRLQDGHWTTYDRSSGLPSNSINALLESRAPDGSPVLWAGTNQGLARWQHNRWQVYQINNSFDNEHINCLLETASATGKKILWAGSDKGLARLDDSSSENGRWQIYDTNNGLPNNSVNILLATSSAITAGLTARESIWLGTNGGLARFDAERGEWQVYNKTNGLPDDKVQSLIETIAPDGSAVLEVGTYGGLARLSNNRWQLYDINRGLPNNIVASLLKEDAGNAAETRTDTLWVGTFGGLTRMEQARWVSFNNRTGLPDNTVWTMTETGAKSPRSNETADTYQRHAYWVATETGVACWLAGRWLTFNTGNGLPGNSVNALLTTKAPDGTETLWVGTNGGGLASLVLDEKTLNSLRVNNQISTNQILNGQMGPRLDWHIDNTASGLPNNKVGCLLATTAADGTLTLWVGTKRGGLGSLNLSQPGSKWVVYNTSSDLNDKLPNNWLWTLHETIDVDGGRSLWVGTNGGGLARRQHDRWIIYDTNTGLPNNSIMALHESVELSNNHTLWAGSLGGGVARLNLSEPNARWQKLNLPLPNQTINEIREDARHRIYLFTNKGITRLTRRTPTDKDPDEFSTYTFTIDDGLPSNECNQGGSMVDSLGRIWAGSLGGVAIFDPNRELQSHPESSILIEKIHLNDKPRALPANSALSYRENSLSFEYSLLNFHRETDTRYQTQLIGLDEHPSEWTSDFKREYTTLPEGDYIFKVWGRDGGGNITGPAIFPFRIKAAPWRTWWAYLAYTLLIVSCGYGAIRLRLQALHRHTELLEAKVQARTTELAQKNQQLDKKNEQLDKKIHELAEKNAELIRSKEELQQSHKRTELIFSAFADVLPGTVLDEKYRLENKIGAGGFGAVYRAIHLALNRPVAVKIFRPSANNANTEALERFQREGISTCRINHPNAVAVLDSGVSANGIAYLVMELLEGRSLADELRAKGALSPARCAEIILPVCDVLARAHAMGVIHRDIKPDNVFLHHNAEGEIVKVVDFGIAKLLGEGTGNQDLQELTATGVFIGTPAYMSPERLDNRPYDGKADVYSVGVMLYRMLCGRVPFQAEDGNLVSVVIMHMKDAPMPLREIRPEIPVEVETAVLSALKKDPQHRPNARELAEDYAAAVGVQAPAMISGHYKITLNGEITSANSIAAHTEEQNTIATATVTEQITLIKKEEELTAKITKESKKNIATEHTD